MTGIKDAKCVLVIGATAGIGRALALAIHNLENKPTVIVAGRRQERLDDIAKGDSGVKTARVDINTTHEKLKEFVEDLVKKHPDLDAVILSSGIQHIFDFTKPETIDMSKVDDEFNTNYVAIIKLITLLLPHFLKLSAQGRPSFIVPITSGLAITPKPDPGLHSLSLSLRAQLAKTKVHVMEIMPPYVRDTLDQGTASHLSKFWMPLDEFTKEALNGLVEGKPEIPVGFVVKAYDKYEAGKREHLEEGFKMISGMES
ncbi:NAD(P)-binding protein [Daedaleopsis nitida]|nr:NAD(P)-binding protein [Daedaleopsis nitida]